MSDKLKVYISRISGKKEMTANISKVEMVLNSEKIEYELIDVSQDHAFLDEMRTLMNDPKGIPIQFVKGGIHLGDFNVFDEAVECKTVKEFCKC